PRFSTVFHGGGGFSSWFCHGFSRFFTVGAVILVVVATVFHGFSRWGGYSSCCCHGFSRFFTVGAVFLVVVATVFHGFSRWGRFF
ncbi:MAG: hypothetical protein K6D37_00250, partial [Prevotella sp.]|nr:hypothetical protein [Prevotella sp.]